MTIDVRIVFPAPGMSGQNESSAVLAKEASVLHEVFNDIWCFFTSFESWFEII